MKASARQGAVPQATRFVQLLRDNVPPRQADARVYNMLVSVCVAAQNVPAALAAGDMLRSTGRSWDAILYTNLITGEFGWQRGMSWQQVISKWGDASAIWTPANQVCRECSVRQS